MDPGDRIRGWTASARICKRVDTFTPWHQGSPIYQSSSYRSTLQIGCGEESPRRSEENVKQGRQLKNKIRQGNYTNAKNQDEIFNKLSLLKIFAVQEK